MYLTDAPKCSYKGSQRIYAGIGEKVLLLCDMSPFPTERHLEFQWKFLGLTSSHHDQEKQILRTTRLDDGKLVDKFHYDVENEFAFGKLVCSARSILSGRLAAGEFDDESLKGAAEKPCIFEIVPKGM